MPKLEKYVIKKYENRKFYDTCESNVVNLEDIFRLNAKKPLVVIDAFNKDITLYTLLQGAEVLLKRRAALGHIKVKEALTIRNKIQEIGELLI